MKILLDECVPKRLARELVGHTVRTVPQMGWATTKNGRLLALAEGEFDVFLTVDRNLSFQQHLPQFKIAVLMVRCRTNRFGNLRPLVPQILAALPTCKHGQVVRVGL
jgi:predicted nuclease of predicted toxin-antitoxin system